MGDARRRKAEIKELKKKPREKKRKKRVLGKAKTERISHFKNAAKRREALRTGAIDPRLLNSVELKIMTPVEIEPTRQPRLPQPFPLVIGAKDEELAHYVAAMAQIAQGRGFRQPSAKAKNWQSTSLVEKLAIAHLDAEKNEFKRSERGQKKLQARNETNALIALDRLIEQYPQRAAQAKTDERMLNWFVASVEQDRDVDREWLRLEAKTRLGGIDFKFLHSAEKARRENIREAKEAA